MSKRKEWRSAGGSTQRRTAEATAAAAYTPAANNSTAEIVTSTSTSSKTTKTVAVYDSRGAAVYICAVVSIYAVSVLVFVAILVAVRRRQQRKSSDADDDERKMAHYLASVAKLRQLNVLRNVGPSKRVDGDGGGGCAAPPYRGCRPEHQLQPWCLTSPACRQLPVCSADHVRKVASRRASAGDRYGQVTWSGSGPRPSDRATAATNGYNSDRDVDRPCRKIIHGSLASISKEARCGNGYCNAGLRSTSPGDDVITLIQVAAPASLTCTAKRDKRTMTSDGAEKTSPEVDVTSPTTCADTSDISSSRCRWSTSYNGDIWVLQMETDDLAYTGDNSSQLQTPSTLSRPPSERNCYVATGDNNKQQQQQQQYDDPSAAMTKLYESGLEAARSRASRRPSIPPI